MKLILVHHNDEKLVASYLPANFRVLATGEHFTMVVGEDDHGWTVDGYVIPRLGSGMIAAAPIPYSSEQVKLFVKETLKDNSVWWECRGIKDELHYHPGQFKVEVHTEDWIGNNLRFDTLTAAKAEARDIFTRWTSVNRWRVLDSHDQTHYTVCWKDQS